MPPAGQRLRTVIRDIAATSPDSATYRQRILDELRAWVPFDAACLGGTDPTALVPTSLTTVGYDDPGIYATVLDIEYGEREEPGSFEALRSRALPIRTLHEALDGRARTSRYYADVLAPNGLEHELRMIFRGHDGICWGVCTMARAGRQFHDREISRLGMVLADVGDGLRTTLFHEATRPLPTPCQGPAMVVLTADNELESATDSALDYLERLAWGPATHPVLIAPAAAVAAWLRHCGQESLALRTRTRDGQWVLIRAGWHGTSGPRGRIVMTIERAHLPEIAELAALAHGLTRRESQVLAHLLAGESRDDMARALCLSPHTVQDHLKKIYAKTGASGRRGVVTLLVHSEYVPRLGSPVAPSGWFAPPPRQTR